MRVALQEQIAKAHERFGATTLLVSHDLHEVFRLASHIVRIDQGRVTATGAPEEVFSESRVSGKFQVTGQISTIERRDVVNLVTVITANNTMVRVIAFDDDIRRLAPGDHVLVVSKAFNPILLKL
jgi:molybdate transport system ATP-binding protein